MYSSNLCQVRDPVVFANPRASRQYGPRTRAVTISLSTSRVSSRVSREIVCSTNRQAWHGDKREKRIWATNSENGLLGNTGLLCGGCVGGGGVRARETATRAYREEDWAELFRPEAIGAKELNEYLNEEPLWLWVFKSWYSGIKGALQFLWEQPGQIKHIEWPSLEITVKMALLTLVVVMLLIVFLSTVDSLFSYLLASSLRRLP